jgi:hypothetical protein
MPNKAEEFTAYLGMTSDRNYILENENLTKIIVLKKAAFPKRS